MDIDSIKRKWADDQTTLGAWLSMREPLVAEAAGGAGFDYVCVDMQHGLSELRDAFASLQALRGGTATPIVRVPWNEPGIIGRALDMGALGVIIPMVNSRAEAQAAVAACRYAPDGKRSFGPIVPGMRYGADYFSRANAGVACIPMIETVEAIAQLDDILSVPGIDAVYVGPADLSITMGLPPAGDHDDQGFQDALAKVVDGCRRHGVTPGIHATAGLAGARHEQGFRMITVAMDFLGASASLRADLATARQLGKPSGGNTGPYG